MEKIKILILDDSLTDVEFVQRSLKKGNIDFNSHIVDNKEDFIQSLIEYKPELIISDYRLPDFSGMEALKCSMYISPFIPVIIISGVLGDEQAAGVIRAGASDFLLKDNLEKLPGIVARALKESQTKKSKKEAEENLKKRNEELSKVNESLQQFAYVVTHDLRAPVINIKMALEQYIEEEIKLPINKKLFKILESSVGKVDGILNDLIKIAGLNKATEYEIRDTIVLEDLLNDLIATIKLQVEESKVTITKNFEISKIHYIPSHLNSILLNLLTNAIKYRSSNRPLVVKIGATQIDDFICISFEDNGMGMDLDEEKIKTKLFGLFRRLHDHVDGKGVGLYIVKKLVESKGGKIEVESEIDKGSTFKIYLKQSKKIKKAIA